MSDVSGKQPVLVWNPTNTDCCSSQWKCFYFGDENNRVRSQHFDNRRLEGNSNVQEPNLILPITWLQLKTGSVPAEAHLIFHLITEVFITHSSAEAYSGKERCWLTDLLCMCMRVCVCVCECVCVCNCSGWLAGLFSKPFGTGWLYQTHFCALDQIKSS